MKSFAKKKIIVVVVGILIIAAVLIITTIIPGRDQKDPTVHTTETEKTVDHESGSGEEKTTQPTETPEVTNDPGASSEESGDPVISTEASEITEPPIPSSEGSNDPIATEETPADDNTEENTDPAEMTVEDEVEIIVPDNEAGGGL